MSVPHASIAQPQGWNVNILANVTSFRADASVLMDSAARIARNQCVDPFQRARNGTSERTGLSVTAILAGMVLIATCAPRTRPATL